MPDFSLITILGFVAGGCSTIAFLPQVIRTWITRSAHDISSGMLLLLLTGAGLWLTYGILDTDIPVIVANSGVLVLISILIAVKIRFDARS